MSSQYMPSGEGVSVGKKIIKNLAPEVPPNASCSSGPATSVWSRPDTQVALVLEMVPVRGYIRYEVCCVQSKVKVNAKPAKVSCASS